MSSYRLPSGGLVNRSQPIRFSFDSLPLHGCSGDTLASALLANGVSLVARSFKYHRPRGIYSIGVEEPNALVTLHGDIKGEPRREPNARATSVELYEGLTADSQNRWPSLAFDLSAINGLFWPLLAAGFYYKTFMGPTRKAWMFYERFIRNAAGMGRGGLAADPDRYDKVNAFCDVLVVGSGPSGLMAACSAVSAGARVILCEEAPYLGGSLVAAAVLVDGVAGADWCKQTSAKLKSFANLRVMTRTTVYGYFDMNTLGALERVTDHLPESAHGRSPRQRHWTIRARRVVLATGALERPIVFANNDLPGIMLADAARRYALQFGVAIGRRVAVFANNNSGHRVALDLRNAGVAVTTLIDSRKAIPPETLKALTDQGIRVLLGSAVQCAIGGKALEAIEVASLAGGVPERIEVDALAVSGGFSPVVHLASQAGTAPRWRDDLAAFVPGDALQPWVAAGACTGAASLYDCLAQGIEAGSASIESLELSSTPMPPPNVEKREKQFDWSHIEALWEVPFRGSGAAKKFVDLQHDVTADDVRLACREGFRSVEHLKRYTTLGMATDQGKTSGVNGLAIMAAERGLMIADVGTTRFRPPYSPVPIGALAGREVGAHHKPVRQTPMHDWHVAHDGAMVATGMWLRPRAYLRAGETVGTAYVREAAGVRKSVGIVDVSTLGKIDVQGPDAAEFLNRVYVNEFKTLPVGKARYGVMLREDGIVFDDGTTWRLSESQYLMTTTTANAAAVLQHLEFYLAVVWPELKVQVTSVTEQWAAMAIAGPNSRTLLSDVIEGIDFQDTAFPFMGVRQGRVGAVPVLVARLSFSGEMAFEVYCGAGYGLALWEKLLASGVPYDIVPYGIEALGTLRIEKGHISGAELDGRTTLGDLGLARMASKKKAFIGQTLMNRPGFHDIDRLQFVGLVSASAEPLRSGAHLVQGADSRRPGRSLGHVTSSTYSPVLGRQIALALLEGGILLAGQTIYVTDPVRSGGHSAAKVVDPRFYDPDGSRMHG